MSTTGAPFPIIVCPQAWKHSSVIHPLELLSQSLLLSSKHTIFFNLIPFNSQSFCYNLLNGYCFQGFETYRDTKVTLVLWWDMLTCHPDFLSRKDFFLRVVLNKEVLRATSKIASATESHPSQESSLGILVFIQRLMWLG